MNAFVINGIAWQVKYVNPNNAFLFRTDGSQTVGMTDWNTKTIYLANILRGAFLERVLCHELCHCFCFSYGISMDIQQEEFLANWISTYGREVIDLLDELLKQSNNNRGMA